MQQILIGGDIRHRFAIMCIADITPGIDYAVQGHAPQLEEIDFLAIGSCHSVVRVRQADKRDTFIHPILLEHQRLIGPYRHNLRTATRERLVFIPKARQLRAAVRSHETAQEREHNRLTAKIR
jgi:hypothetical protein